MEFMTPEERLEQAQEARQQAFIDRIQRVDSCDPSAMAVYRTSDGHVAIRYQGGDYSVSSLCLDFVTHSGSRLQEHHRYYINKFNGTVLLCKPTPGSSEGCSIMVGSPTWECIASSEDNEVSIYFFVQSDPVVDERNVPVQITAVGASTYPNRLVDPFACEYVAFTTDSELCRPLVELFGRYYFSGAKPALMKEEYLERLQLEKFDCDKGTFHRIGGRD